MAFRQAADGSDSPLGIASTPSEPDRLYIVEQPGLVRGGGRRASPSRSSTCKTRSERRRAGLLSLAFDPEYESTGLFYVDYTDTNGDTRVVEYHAGASAPSGAASFVDQPYANHNGGQLAFRAGRPARRRHGRRRLGRRSREPGPEPGRELGKLLSLDADPGVREKDWTIEGYGLRNPWRFSFDRETGDLWIGDVAREREEIDHTARDSQASRTTAGTSTRERTATRTAT